MDDIFFTESDEAPVPPEEVRIRVLEAVTRPDGQRVDVRLEVTPFQQRPNMELRILDDDGQEVATLSVVEAIDAKMEFTMHIRGARGAGDYTLSAQLFYADIEGAQAEKDGEVSSGEILRKSRQIVDEKQTAFSIE